MHYKLEQTNGSSRQSKSNHQGSYHHLQKVLEHYLFSSKTMQEAVR